MGAEEDICAPMIQQAASPASLSPPGQEQPARKSIYSVSNDFSRTGKYHDRVGGGGEPPSSHTPVQAVRHTAVQST